ncbi:hypothetical protein VP01_2024g2 [Puccinia sorghi]|uniref:Uncharacterized protein n=1 Tax=Puccinia sorghi TaxID=27349 RepID=A0A0L6VB08_9BASI|nr:hypothetical protein VP01_2024g2 [Puccinia sorghi]
MHCKKKLLNCLQCFGTVPVQSAQSLCIKAWLNHIWRMLSKFFFCSDGSCTPAVGIDFLGAVVFCDTAYNCCYLQVHLISKPLYRQGLTFLNNLTVLNSYDLVIFIIMKYSSGVMTCFQQYGFPIHVVAYCEPMLTCTRQSLQEEETTIIWIGCVSQPGIELRLLGPIIRRKEKYYKILTTCFWILLKSCSPQCLKDILAYQARVSQINTSGTDLVAYNIARTQLTKFKFCCAEEMHMNIQFHPAACAPAALNFVTSGYNCQLNSNFAGSSIIHIIQVNFPSIQLSSRLFCHLSSQLLALFSSIIIDTNNETQYFQLRFMCHKKPNWKTEKQFLDAGCTQVPAQNIGLLSRRPETSHLTSHSTNTSKENGSQTELDVDKKLNLNALVSLSLLLHFKRLILNEMIIFLSNHIAFHCMAELGMWFFIIKIFQKVPQQPILYLGAVERKNVSVGN